MKKAPQGLTSVVLVLLLGAVAMACSSSERAHATAAEQKSDPGVDSFVREKRRACSFVE